METSILVNIICRVIEDIREFFLDLIEQFPLGAGTPKESKTVLV